MSYENDAKSIALLMCVGAFKEYKPRDKQEEEILNNLKKEGLVKKLEGSESYVLNELDVIYERLSAKGIREIQNNRNQEADYPQK